LGTWDFDPLHDKFKTNQRLKSWFGLPVTEEIELSQATIALIEKDRSRVSDTIQKVLSGETDGKYDII
jgi:hypothetical protein